MWQRRGFIRHATLLEITLYEGASLHFAEGCNLMTIVTKTKSQTPASGLLTGYLSRAELASEWNCHERTIARYEAMPNGLPFLYIGGRKLYRIDDALAFMERRITTPNPVRKKA